MFTGLRWVLLQFTSLLLLLDSHDAECRIVGFFHAMRRIESLDGFGGIAFAARAVSLSGQVEHDTPDATGPVDCSVGR